MTHSWIRKLIRDAEDNPDTQIAIHKWFMRFWLINFVVASIVFWVFPQEWLRFSVFYIVAVSLYANFATDYDALSAAQASKHALEAREAAKHEEA